MNLNNQTQKSLYLLGITLFFIGLYVGYFIKSYNVVQYINNFKPYRINDSHYSFIYPLVGIESPSSLTIGINTALNKDLKDIIAYNKRNNNVQDVAVYYRDLNSSSWFGINEEEEFIPASLLKITYALSAYKQKESEPNFFSKRAIYTEKIANINNSIKGAQPSVLVVGNSYSVSELVKIMLLKSDNGAKDMLTTLVDTKYVAQLYALLEVTNPDPVHTYTISAKNYSLFFRVLYSATFLNNDDSEELLSYLYGSTFVNGLVAGVPSDVKVSHKYGLYDKINGGVEMYKELHDCGVVYDTTRPYILCVMTKGGDEKKLEELIKNISQKVYESVDSK